jgi:phosphatidylserine/phosphatidylglycerophosphate/cardiolipin synthase-like enzyme
LRKSRTARSHYFLFVLILLSNTACIPFSTTPLTVPESFTNPGLETQDDWLQVYFADPGSPEASDFMGGPDKALAAAIDGARLTVDAAIYNLNLWSIRNALLEAHARGVMVRVVAESDNLDGAEFQALMDAGIPVLGDRREGLMHDKFVVIDRNEVWTGSMNFTLNGAYEDNNNLIRLRSGDIADDYLVEFNEMFVDDLFGSNVLARTPNPRVTVGDTVVEVYFSPDDGVQTRLVELLEAASESIYFMAYSFTADPLGETIRSKAASGVTVAGVMDAEQAISNTGTEYDPFIQAGLDVRLDGIDGLMHHKVIIIDGNIVITGSYNFTLSAESTNDENVLIIHDSEIASIYLGEFWRIYNRALP